MPTIIELPAGTYTLTGDVSGSRDVLTLTASITETTLSVGQTASITTNATAGTATYQWRLDGTPISGATSATYTTAATGALTCIVDSGAQSVTTAAVTVATGAIDPVLIATDNFGLDSIANGGTRTVTNGFPSAGQYVVMIHAQGNPAGSLVDVSAAGATVTELASLGSSFQVSGRALFVNATGAANCVFTNNSGGTIFNIGAFIYNVTGATNAGAITNTGANNASSVSAVLAAVPTGHSVIAGCVIRGSSLTSTWGGSFVSSDEDNEVIIRDNRTISCASVVAATGGGNFTATVSPSATADIGLIAVALAKA